MRLAKNYGSGQEKKEFKRSPSVHIRRDNGIKIPLTKERGRFHDDAQEGDEELIIRRLRRKYSVSVDDNIDKIIDKVIDMGWDITHLQPTVGDRAFYVKATKLSEDGEEISVDRMAVRL